MPTTELISPVRGPFVSDGPVPAGAAPTGRWTLNLAYRLGSAQRTRLLAHAGTPGQAPGWSFGVRGDRPFLEVRGGETRHLPLGATPGGPHVASLRGEDDRIVALDIAGAHGDPVSYRVADRSAGGAVLEDGLGPFAPTPGVTLGGLRDRAGGHADLRFGLDDGDELLRAEWQDGWPEVDLTRLRAAPDTPPAPEGLGAAILLRPGDLGYAGFRIPGLVRTPDGALLAACEGRVESLSDSCPTKDLLVLRSEDGGRSWAPPVVAVRGATLFGSGRGSAMNPSLLADRVHGTRRTLLVFTALAADEWAVEAGHGGTTLMQVHSDDDGRSWSEPRPLLDPAAVPPDLPTAFPDLAGRSPAMRIPSLGHGLQWTDGPARGTMAICGNATYAGQSVFDSVLHLLLSDDAGAHWRFGPTPAHWSDGRPARGLNEASLAPLPNGGLLASVRAYRDGEPTGRRALLEGRWTDAGTFSWDAASDADDLVAPAVHGSATGWTAPDGSARLALAHPHHPRERRALSLRIRRPDGPWTAGILVRAGFSAYSDLVHDPADDALIVAYERSLDGALTVARFTGASDAAPEGTDR